MFRYIRAALAAAALFLIAPLMNANPAPDKDGHVLTALWKQYEEASKADRPQKEAEILTKIKDEAARQRLAADFYDAAVKYVESVQRRDWKKREELRKNLEKEVKGWGFLRRPLGLRPRPRGGVPRRTQHRAVPRHRRPDGRGDD